MNSLRENKFRLPLPYHDTRSTVMLGVLITFMPIWLVWIPYRILQSPAVQNLLIAPMGFTPDRWFDQPQIWYPDHFFKETGLIVSLFCLLALILLIDRRLIISNQGIRFPAICSIELRTKLFRLFFEASYSIRPLHMWNTWPIFDFCRFGKRAARL